MKTLTAVLEKPYEISMQALECQKPKPGHALIRMMYCGICGSDIGAYKGTNPTMRYPIMGMGHEGVGIVEEIEPGSEIKVGDRVALEPYIPCGKCYICKEGGNNCTDLHVSGVHCPCMMTEYYRHPVSLLHRIPDELTWERAVLTEPLTIALHGIQRAEVKAGDVCVITGAGPIGLLAALAAKAYGAVPVIMDVIESRLKFAGECGIENRFNNFEGGFEEYLCSLTCGRLADAMVECTGAPPILAKMHDYVRNSGRIALVGWPKDPLTVNTIRWMQKELSVRPSRNSHNNFPEALELIRTRAVPAERLLTKVIEFKDFEQTIKDMTEHPQNYMKVAVKIGE